MTANRTHLTKNHRRWAFAALLVVTGAISTSGQASPADSSPESDDPVTAQTEPSDEFKLSSREQGQSHMDERFGAASRRWQLETRRHALRDTRYHFQFRSFYMNRKRFDGSHSEAWAVGGWAGLKTGYFLDRISFGFTGYTSQHLAGDDDTDGTLLLAPGQEGYSVLGELYGDVRFHDNLHLYAGRMEYDTPYVNRDDSRMTPNTFEAVGLLGKADVGANGEIMTYGLGYFDQIKTKNSDDFVSMSRAAGASVERGVFTAGGQFTKGPFSIGAIDYYSPDIINIAYAEARFQMPLCDDLNLNLAAQFSDQRSVGDKELTGSSFNAQQIGLKAEIPWRDALFTAGYTQAFGDSDMRSPWSGYPGYTSVQVESFNREGEGAFLLRAAYHIAAIPGLSTYALWVHGTDPDVTGQYRRDEFDANIEWAPLDGALKGLSLRLRYAHVAQADTPDDSLDDFRVIANYRWMW